MAAVILPDIISGGLFMSTKPAMTKPQLATGPQKWVVLGPTGLFRNDLSAVAMGEGKQRKSPSAALVDGGGGRDKSTRARR